ncbi:MAG: DNA translocase FtsK 4TM domain-containing protein, partial [Hyphomicrobiales bacterium]|nr:DNA translocase FtsK 4TM domain-containing protein [Hyphomicrobiales bacterium]
MTNWTDGLNLAPRGWQPAQNFLRRRISELAGLALFFAALLLGVMLLSYDRRDPSWSHAEAAPVNNWVGPLGADLADILYQTLGLAPLLLSLVLFAWSFRLLLNRGLALWSRLLLLPPMLLLASMAVAALPVPGWWQLSRVGLGGWFGDSLLHLVGGFGLLAPAALGLVAAVLAALLLLHILGLSWRDWQDIGEGAGRVAAVSGRGTAWAAQTGARFAFWLRSRRPAAAAKPEPKKPLARREPSLDSGREAADEDDEPALVERQPRRAMPRDLIAPKPASAAPGKRAAPPRQTTLDLDPDTEHALPSLDLLAAPPPPGKQTATVNEEAL